MATRKTVQLSTLAKFADLVDSAPVLDPSDYDGDILVDYRCGRPDLLDGHHRVAGLLSWCVLHEVDDIEISIVDTTDADENVVAAAAVPEGFGALSQDEAIDALLRDASALARNSY